MPRLHTGRATTATPIRQAAVIGAGAAGLATARALRDAGIAVQVFEAGNDLGGIWRYDPRTETDPLGQRGPRIHSSLYDSLRTNLPCDLMGFVDVPFVGDADDARRFPGHARVLRYLEDFAARFQLRDYVRWGARVVSAQPADSGSDDRWPRWRLRIAIDQGAAEHDITVDAVAICSGHYAEPRVPALPGDTHFPAARIHSHNYRAPDDYRDRTVALWGGSASALDLAREIASVARKLYWCAHAPPPGGAAPAANPASRIERRPDITALLPDGRLQLADDSTTPPVDALLYCTGYHFRYPFFDTSVLGADDNFVSPLYHELLHVRFDSLGLIGVPFRIVPFPLFAQQASYLARLWRGSFAAPSPVQRQTIHAQDIDRLQASGVPRRLWHQRTIDCYDYLDALAEESGAPRMPDWHRVLTRAYVAHAAAHPGVFREHPFEPAFGAAGPARPD